ncbi:MAG: acetoacetate--CoA ligase [Pseudomonadales bacterium]|jgi:acetoacetyl-CoA synthetase|nr:acetoacetate--CoA ligase [Pseudomonadales bacterium]MDP7314641.1 acetoacetate--CoA ligase [Pseudomonadales bacterium]|tara:strand:- start:24398 stop:26311 length:1914 start_codon:yes stop_codon:yes gene_type:complete
MNEPLWIPGEYQRADTRMWEFQQHVDVKGSYDQLHAFSVREKELFWSKLWDFCDVIGERGDQILNNHDRMQGAEWFPEAKLNFAENLLRFNDDRIALVSCLENGSRRSLSYAEIRKQVECVACWLRNAGVEPGDRIAALMPNVPETVVTMLAATSIGATFSSCSPDFGVSGILDRFGQISPKVLLTCDGYYYNGKVLDISGRVGEIVASVDSIEQVLLVSLIGKESLDLPRVTAYDIASTTDAEGFNFLQTSFDHPLYIMYSSGTTGTPKCIVHGVGGTLLQHLKEHQLHVDLRRDDVLFFFTTCGWMMWNWLVSGLASGATLVLYDGSPFYPSPAAMMDLAEQEKISVFGTSAKFLSSLEKSGEKPRESHDLSNLRSVLSTGSPLSHESFRYVYRDIKQDICLASISGGTDIISCFVLGNPCLPVYAGELQCAGLGMDVHIFNDEGEGISESKGEMVCTSTFPSMPVGFWNDASGEKYHNAYFARFENIWAHGDYGEQTQNNGYIIYGRSDAVLNPGGVRIGTAEIYRQVERIEEVVDSICVGQDWDDDVRVILFVVLRQGIQLTEDIEANIKKTIRENTSPRHVPARIVAVPDVPRTISGKIVELAVRNVIHGLPVTNTDALANPESLAFYKDAL